MIVQEINLYQERFKEKTLLLSAAHMVIISGIAVLLLVLSSYWYSSDFSQAETQHQNYLQQKQQSTQQLETLRKKLESLLADSRIDRQLTKISRDISVRKRMVDFVAKNQFGSGEGFSENLGVLSEFKIDDVWLNEISIADDYIKLSGSALHAEDVPEYFNQFQNRELFNGRVFDVFELDRAQDRDWKVDFIIASRALTDE